MLMELSSDREVGFTALSVFCEDFFTKSAYEQAQELRHEEGKSDDGVDLLFICDFEAPLLFLFRLLKQQLFLTRKSLVVGKFREQKKLKLIY
jgi:hypothetical protein